MREKKWQREREKDRVRKGLREWRRRVKWRLDFSRYNKRHRQNSQHSLQSPLRLSSCALETSEPSNSSGHSFKRQLEHSHNSYCAARVTWLLITNAISWICVSIRLFLPHRLGQPVRWTVGQPLGLLKHFQFVLKAFRPNREGRKLLSLTYALRRAVHAKEWIQIWHRPLPFPHCSFSLSSNLGW